MSLLTERLLTSVNKMLLAAGYWLHNDITQALGLTNNCQVQSWVCFTCNFKTRKLTEGSGKVFPVALHYFCSDLFCYSLMLIV